MRPRDAIGRFATRPWVATFIIVLVVSLNLAFRALLPLGSQTNESTDFTAHYRPTALNLIAGEGIVGAHGEPAIRYPPGYPLALTVPLWLAQSLEMDEDLVLGLWTALLAGLTSAAIFLVASHYYPIPWSATAAVFWAAYPLALWLFKQPNSETVFTPLLIAAFGLFLRATTEEKAPIATLLAIGALAGFLSLVRPIAIAIGTILALVWVWLRRSKQTRAWLGALLIVIGNLAVVLPWEFWVYRNTGRLIPLSTSGGRAIADGLTFATGRKTHREDSRVIEPIVDFMREIEADYTAGMTTGEVVRILAAHATDQPLAAMGLVSLKAARAWYGTDSLRYESAILMIQIPFLMIAAAGLRSAWKLGPPTRSAAFVSSLLVFYFWCMTVVSLSIVRYMVPATALLAVNVASIGVLWRQSPAIDTLKPE